MVRHEGERARMVQDASGFQWTVGFPGRPRKQDRARFVGGDLVLDMFVDQSVEWLPGAEANMASLWGRKA